MPEPASTNYIQSLGQLFQAEQQTIVLQAPPPPSQLPLLASLRQVDRVPQLEQLIEAVGAALTARRATPLVVLVKGTAEDEPMSFAQRVGEHDFEAEMRLPCDYLGSLPWPERSFQRLLTGLTSAIARQRGAAMPPCAAAQDGLVELIAGSDRSIAVAHQLDPAVCLARPELLAAWAKLIAETCRNPVGGLLVCFLCVELRDSRRDAYDRLLDALGGLAATHDWCDLEPLDEVEPRHLEDWIDLYNRQPALLELPRIRPALARELFGAGPRLRYRAAVEGVLAGVMPSLQPFQPRWAA